jgi:hypothetical protein
VAPDSLPPDEFDAPTPDDGGAEEAAMAYSPDAHEEGTGIEGALRRNERELMGTEGVEGIAVGQSSRGQPALVVYVRDPSVRRLLPSSLDGFDVEVVVTGEIEAFPA